MKFRLALAAPAILALAACGGADDASMEAEADSVEMTADDALEGVEEMPVEDDAATMPAESDPAPEATSAAVTEAGDNAAATAEAAMDAMAEDTEN